MRFFRPHYQSCRLQPVQPQSLLHSFQIHFLLQPQIPDTSLFQASCLLLYLYKLLLSGLSRCRLHHHFLPDGIHCMLHCFPLLLLQHPRKVLHSQRLHEELSVLSELLPQRMPGYLLMYSSFRLLSRKRYGFLLQVSHRLHFRRCPLLLQEMHSLSVLLLLRRSRNEW